MQRGGVNLERRMLLLASPYKLRVEMRIIVELGGRSPPDRNRRHRRDVIVNFVSRKRRISLRRYQPNGRIVDALLVGVLVTVNWSLVSLAARAFPSWHLGRTP